jgi:spermidine/putrescine-binding protein
MKASRIVTAGAAALVMCGVLGMAPAAGQASSVLVPAWTKQAPASHPTARHEASMAYDAATGTAVLFGGGTTQIFGNGLASDTWTWG